MTPKLQRRELLKAAAGLSVIGRGGHAASPSERVNLAVIGLGGRGQGLATGFARMVDARVVTVCDVDSGAIGRAIRPIAELQGTEPRTAGDLRTVLDDPDVDGVVTAAPDHWHALATIWACQAGKHVYVEKPASHNLHEGRKMVEAARKYQRIVQVGTQSRSAAHYREMVAAIREGQIGRVLTAKAWNGQRRPDLEPRPDAPTPAGVDYNLWLGPAPLRKFNLNRFHYSWHWHWDYGTGDAGNDGIHDLDIARWGLGVSWPSHVGGVGAKLVNRNWETPDTFFMAFDYPESQQVLVYEQRDWSPYLQEGFENGVSFQGTEGYILAGRAGWKLFRGNEPKAVPSQPYSDEPHRQDWLDRIRDGRRPAADVEEGHLSAALAHLANIVYRSGRSLMLDPERQAILGEPEAEALTRRSYREPFIVPEQV